MINNSNIFYLIGCAEACISDAILNASSDIIEQYQVLSKSRDDCIRSLVLVNVLPTMCQRDKIVEQLGIASEMLSMQLSLIEEINLENSIRNIATKIKDNANAIVTENLDTNTSINKTSSVITGSNCNITEPNEHGLKFDDIIGNYEVKQSLVENIILPMLLDDESRCKIFSGIRSGLGNVLLYGPPGTGYEYIKA